MMKKQGSSEGPNTLGEVERMTPLKSKSVQKLSSKPQSQSQPKAEGQSGYNQKLSETIQAEIKNIQSAIASQKSKDKSLRRKLADELSTNSRLRGNQKATIEMLESNS